MALTAWTSLSQATKNFVQNVLIFVKGSGGDTAVYALEVGQQPVASSIPIAIASDQYPVQITGSITANNASVGVTGTAVPADATYIGANVSGNLVGLVATAGGLKTDGSAVTQPVSGTFWQATQPVSAASLPLPAGAATLAKQPALGTAGTASADVITIQGIASMTAVKVDGSGVTQPVSGTFWQATQPVSGTVTANAGTGTFATSATQSGTWTVQPGNTANTTAWLVDRSTAAATFQAEGSIAFGSLTTSYTDLLVTAGSMKWLGLRNSLNQPVLISLDGGTTTHFVLEQGDSVSLDLKSLGLSVATSTHIQAKYTGSAPTSGTIRANGAY